MNELDVVYIKKNNKSERYSLLNLSESWTSKKSWEDAKPFVDAELLYADKSIWEHSIQKGSGIRVDFLGSADSGNVIVESYDETSKLAKVNVYVGQSYVALVKIIDNRYKIN